MTSHLFVHRPSLLSDSHTGTTALCLLSDPLTGSRRRRRTRSLLVSSNIPLSHTHTQFTFCTASCWRLDGDVGVARGSGTGRTYTLITAHFWDHKHTKIWKIHSWNNTQSYSVCVCCLFDQDVFHFLKCFMTKRVWKEEMALNQIASATPVFCPFLLLRRILLALLL